jgi:site-specific DNA-cytosine methylase
MSHKIIYLASYKANHPNYDIIYQDINGERDIAGDMMDVDLSPYDIIIATPPCNWWSNAFRTTRKISKYAEKTKELLPSIIKKLEKIGKPYIVENVRNKPLFLEYGLFELSPYIYTYGRHTYWTNIAFNPNNISQKNEQTHFTSSKNRQGGQNVHNVIEHWLKVVTS